MTREQFVKACEMRANGFTYQEIGDSFGCTRQYIQQTMKEMLRNDGYKISSKTVYPNLEREIKIKHRTVKRFTENTGIKYRRMSDILHGKRKVFLEEAIFFSEYLDKEISYLFTENN